ncbi:MAG: hypothetical protein JWQ30_1889 [Sediminibacterium sp.]|nr:hypothetical protein [Sediminibacterium sp.]
MDQKEFDRLTDTCSRILRRFSSDYAIVAIPWLHILNGHPNSIRQYAHAFKRRNFFSAAGSFLYNLAYIFFKLLRSVILFRSNKINIDGELVKSDVLFISHLVSLSLSEKDFYFATLPSHLYASTGSSATIGLIDHTPSTRAIKIRSRKEAGDPQRVVFSKTMSFRSEFTFASQCFSSFFKLIGAAGKEEDKITKNIFREAAIHAMAPETLAALRIREHIRQLLEQTAATTLLFTWEGRSWERMGIHAAGSLNRSIRCLGYQHTILLASSKALTKSLGKEYDPDVIFTIGKKTAEVIRSANEFHDTPIIEFGSYRLSVSSIQYPGPKENVLQCLVTPEGLESECVLLFDFAIQLAERSPGMNFIFRNHPVLPYDMLAKKYPRFVKLPVNCRLSDESDINEDFKRSDLLLYRGSSVCMYAVMLGLRPVYYALPGELSIDPLYQLKEWRFIVQNEHEFSAAVTDHRETPAGKKNEMYLAARSFCTDYLQVPDENFFYEHILIKNKAN